MKILLSLFALVWLKSAFAQETIPLYSGAIPGAIDLPDEESLRDPNEPYRFLLNTSRPTVTVFLPTQRANTPAVLIFPGGSYRGTSIVKEGYEVAAEFAKMGIAAFVVKYRTPNDRHMRNRTTAPLQDAQEAMRLVRTRAVEWHVDATKIGIVGFSAGGHLAATAAMRYDDPVSPSSKNVEKSVRPAFLILAYPVVSMTDELTHALSRSNLLGEAPTQELIWRYSMELNVRPDAAPTFLMHAADDKTVKVANTIRLFEALHAHGVPVEMHIYPSGGHGFGLNNATTSDRWIERCKQWLIGLKIIAD